MGKERNRAQIVFFGSLPPVTLVKVLPTSLSPSVRVERPRNDSEFMLIHVDPSDAACWRIWIMGRKCHFDWCCRPLSCAGGSILSTLLHSEPPSDELLTSAHFTHWYPCLLVPSPIAHFHRSERYLLPACPSHPQFHPCPWTTLRDTRVLCSGQRLTRGAATSRFQGRTRQITLPGFHFLSMFFMIIQAAVGFN